MISHRKLWVTIAALVICGAGQVFENTCHGQSKPQGNKVMSEEGFEKSFPTPLLQAIALGQSERVEYLLSNGASPNGKDRTTHTRIPLLLASDRGNLEIVKLLLARKAKIEVRNEIGFTALMIATLRQDIKLVELLLSRGADVNGKTDEHATPVMVAAQLGSLPILKTLLHANANVNASTKLGVTALMEADDSADIIVTLLKANASVEAKDNDGATPLGYARSNNHAMKATLLIEAGAKDTQCP